MVPGTASILWVMFIPFGAVVRGGRIAETAGRFALANAAEIGRASCRERVLRLV